MARTEEQKRKRREYDKRIRTENTEQAIKIRAYQKEYMRKQRSITPDEYCPITSKKRYIKSKYGLKWDAYLELLEKTGGSCPICKNKFLENPMGTGIKGPKSLTHPVIDHNHITGEIRGIICGSCNSGLGFFRDNVETMVRAIEYIKNKEV